MYGETATESLKDVPYSQVAAKRVAELDREISAQIDRLSEQIGQMSAEREMLLRLRNSTLVDSNAPQLGAGQVAKHYPNAGLRSEVAMAMR